MGADVRSKEGLPVLSDFNSGGGTPVVVDRVSGAAAILTSNDEVLEFAREAGWEDLLAPIDTSKVIGANQPSWDMLVNGVYGYAFSASTMNECWVQLHIPHDYEPLTMVYPHVHWTSAGTSTGVIRWGLEYTYARGYGIEPFPASTTVYLEQAGTGVAKTHMIAEAPEGGGLTIPTLEPDGLLLIRVFRDAGHANDTLTDKAFCLFADLHYQSDGMLTNERNRTFTKKRGLVL